MGCLQLLHIASVVNGSATWDPLDWESMLGLLRAGVRTVAMLFESFRNESRRAGLGLKPLLLSLCFAFSTALLSYSSQSLAVFAGVHGGGLGSLNGDIVLAIGEGCSMSNDIVEVNSENLGM